MAQAQDSGQGSSSMLAPSSTIGQMQGAGATTGIDVAQPSIGNAPSLESQQRGGRASDQARQSTLDRSGENILTTDLPTGPGRLEFQDFVARSVGRELPVFGTELFRNVPSTFAPVDNVPVTSDYVIGPGDEILIRAWGQLDFNYAATVDRLGQINIPKVGTINIAGVKYHDLNAYLKSAIGRIFRNFDLAVSMGQLRSIRVFVVGQARRPGSYTISSMSTLVNAVFAAGGPSVKGSMRRIELKRGNSVVTEFDLYDLLINGDKSKDARLLPGDVIYFAPVGSLVAISGSVNVPAIFELKNETTLADLIAWAGGLASTAAGQKALVERIDENRKRKVDTFKLGASGTQVKLHDGDIVSIASVGPRIENAVTLRGNVAAPARVPWRQGMRIRDLIPSSAVLISSKYWQAKNENIRVDTANGSSAKGISPPVISDLTIGLGVGQGTQAGGRQALSTNRADEITRNLNEVNWDYAVIERMNPKDLSTTLLPFNLGKAVLEGDPTQNLLLQPGDVVTVFSVDDIQVPIAAQTKYVRLEGEFVNPGIYRVDPGETLRQLVARVGGLTPNAYLFGAEFTRESNRIYQQKKLEEAVKRLEREIQASAISRAKNVTSTEEAAGLSQDAQAQQVLIAKLRRVKATGRIVLELPADDSASIKDLPEIALEDSDRLIVPSRPSMVNVIGSVYNENAFVYKPEKRLTDYLQQAGGVSKSGDKADVYLLRVDGSVISKRQSGWLMGSLDGAHLMPGDTIVVPEEFDRTTWTKMFKDWGQILYQFGLGAAAIKVIKD